MSKVYQHSYITVFVDTPRHSRSLPPHCISKRASHRQPSEVRGLSASPRGRYPIAADRLPKEESVPQEESPPGAHSSMGKRHV